MADRPSNLPDYKNPPVSEVVLSFQFGALANFRNIHSGLLWEIFKKQFPRYSEQPPLMPVFETFGQKPAGPHRISVQVTAAPMVSRYWFLNESQTQLIQFQPDRFAHNWRKIGKGDEYPRYEKIKAQFASEFRKINKFLRDNDIGKMVPTQVEVTYVNHISSKGGTRWPPNYSTVFRFWSNPRYGTALNHHERSKFQSAFIIESEDGEPVGRLHINAEPAWQKDGTPTIQLTLTARGRPLAQTQKSAFEFLDLGREKIVHGFTEFTTDKLHTLWGRKK